MYNYKDMEDTIVAISTAAGAGAIGIVRLSGKDAIEIADRMFVSKGNKKVAEMKSHSVCYGDVVDVKAGKPSLEREIIDEVLLTVMRGPKSYTREDVVEFGCHGGMMSVKAVLVLATDLVARLAEPGEFTKRAFLNGRIDLTQAESVLDIINAKTKAFLKVSANQLKGQLSLELDLIRQKLMDIYVEIEAIVNFPEDGINVKNRPDIADRILVEKDKVRKLLETSDHGKILKEGIKIALCGKSNVGKSSLLNVLLNQPRAIVSSIAGTTRDSIEESVQIKGIPFQLVDTAGIIAPRDLIEEEAIKRSRMHFQSADIVLLVIDAGSGLSKEDIEIMENVVDRNVIVVANKCDLEQIADIEKVRRLLKDPILIKVSATEGFGIDELETAIVNNVWHQKTVDTHGVMISNLRHVEALKKCFSLLEKAEQDLRGELSLEFISEDIKISVNFLDNITGRNIDHDLLDNIFSQFCIGK